MSPQEKALVKPFKNRDNKAAKQKKPRIGGAFLLTKPGIKVVSSHGTRHLW